MNEEVKECISDSVLQNQEYKDELSYVSLPQGDHTDQFWLILS